MTRYAAHDMPAARLDALDLFLVLLFLFGIYTGLALPIAKGVPFPSAPSGVAGLLLLFRHAGRARQQHLVALLFVLVLYLANILVAPDKTYLLERIKGLIQLAYSLIIGYGMFLTLAHADRRQLGRILLFICLALIAGCMLERTVEPFKALSDAVREKIYDAFMVYQADDRDLDLYGGVRPKLFTSEPSAVTFAFTLFSFGWLAIAPWRDWRVKLVVYVAMLGAGYVAMSGPTLMLGLALVVPYLMIIEPWRGPGPERKVLPSRVFGVALLGVVLAVAAVVGVTHLYAARLEEVSSSSDPSFFYRITGPPLVAWDVLLRYPWTGAGLTGEEFISERVLQVYFNSPSFSPDWKYDTAASVLTNYFWHHWIYLGPLWGIALLGALSLWLRTLGVVNLTACWIAWIILGMASGAYVSPKTWFVLLLTAAASVLHHRQPVGVATGQRRTSMRLRPAMERP